MGAAFVSRNVGGASAGQSAFAPPRLDDQVQGDKRFADSLPAGTLEAVARQLLLRWGVVFRDLVARETITPPWRDLLITFRRMEAQGEIRGGRFVSGFVGEQFARPEAVELLREVRRDQNVGAAPHVSAADPLNLAGIITPGSRISPLSGAGVPLWEESTPDDKMGSDPILTNLANASHQAS